MLVMARRITRSSLARFAYAGASDHSTTIAGSRSSDNGSGPDIEDAIPDVTDTFNAAHKRKRTTAISAHLTAPSTAGRRRRRDGSDAEIKNEPEVKIESEFDDSVSINTAPTKPPKRQRRPARKTTDPTTGKPAISPPSDWEEIYAVVRSMRSEGGAAANAAVDTMGCERLALPTASPRDQRFQTLVALMLSSQTKDTVNAVTMRRLQTELEPHAPDAPAGLTLENIIAVAPARLNELIWAVGFHNNKTKYLQLAAAICRDRHDGDIPSTFEGLVALPGVGPKMAHLCLSAAWGRTEGIGVDVHVHRITNLWGWHGKGGSKNPEDTRIRLESWLPRDKWHEINTLLVGLGQTVCLPVGRRCGDCDLGLKGLCPAADRKKVLEGRRLRDNNNSLALLEESMKNKGREEEKEEEESKAKELVKAEMKKVELVGHEEGVVKSEKADDDIGISVKQEGE